MCGNFPAHPALMTLFPTDITEENKAYLTASISNFQGKFL